MSVPPIRISDGRNIDTSTMASRRQNVAAARHSSGGFCNACPRPPSGRILRPISGSFVERRGERRALDFSTEDDAELEAELARLKQEHRDLDTAIEALERMVAGDQLQIQRLKKRKARPQGPDPQARGSAHPRHHRVRPAFICTLREYIARSARAIASSALSFGSRRVDPIEELRGSVRPPSTSGVPRIIASSEAAF